MERKSDEETKKKRKIGRTENCFFLATTGV
jgi:hypothetical protein